jgi:hypothetical protein
MDSFWKIFFIPNSRRFEVRLTGLLAIEEKDS